MKFTEIIARVLSGEASISPEMAELCIKYVEASAKQVDILQDRCEELETALKKAEAKAKELDGYNDFLENEIDELEETRDCMGADIDELVKQRDKLKSELNLLYGKMAETSHPFDREQIMGFGTKCNIVYDAYRDRLDISITGAPKAREIVTHIS